ncbi:MAG TPA: hypothetical protein H9875_04100 [Candidatus Levilactobacillus faecigallinarum]|uniref:Uncharacterized protein n=1 Tax=Candidatus Levilactobacillus faecigallinarum TaxID=2838638 RepID=A0A9D1QRV5_9LACO|nr:hypothetical protein [Candidatus Levilactobacillus faecigallinarum]
MLGYVLGKDGNFESFVETLYQKGDHLSDTEVRLLQELITQAQYPGNSVNMAEKLSLTSTELAANLVQLKADGLIDYWGQPAQQLPVPVYH